MGVRRGINPSFQQSAKGADSQLHGTAMGVGLIPSAHPQVLLLKREAGGTSWRCKMWCARRGLGTKASSF